MSSSPDHGALVILIKLEVGRIRKRRVDTVAKLDSMTLELEM
jgi:hypothetical protein